MSSETNRTSVAKAHAKADADPDLKPVPNSSEVIDFPWTWRPRSYQRKTWEHFAPDLPNLRGLNVWHRRAGKDLLALNLCCYKAFQRVGTYWHLLPEYKQGRAIVWNGMTKGGRRFLDFIPRKSVHRFLDAEMRVHFVNDSVYQIVGTDNINALVGTNPVGCVFSEFSLHDPAVLDYVRPILRENGGWALFVFTPRGRNHAWNLLKVAEREGWLVDIRKAGSGEDRTKRDGIVYTRKGDMWVPKREDGRPVVSDEDIERDRAEGMSEELIDQEYYLSFEASMTGAYYSKPLQKMRAENRICSVPYDTKLPVDTAWDIGGDSTWILFFQTFGLEIRIIDSYQASGEALPHFCKVIKELDYVYGQHFAPWDIEVTEFSSGRTRREVAAALGVKFKVTPQYDVADGIEQVRNIFPRLWIDGTKCERFIDCLGNYQKQPLAPTHQPPPGETMSYKDKPLHNFASHPADALRTLAWNCKKSSFTARGSDLQRTAEDTYVYV